MGKRKLFNGEVISDKMIKTVVVKVMRIGKHPKYGKVFKRYNKFKAHDEAGLAKAGDIVQIEETRPLSKDKHFRVRAILKKNQAKALEVQEGVL